MDHRILVVDDDTAFLNGSHCLFSKRIPTDTAASGVEGLGALASLKRREGWYDPTVLAALTLALGIESSYRARDVSIQGLKPKTSLARMSIPYASGARAWARATS
jgi:hypothetical protein